MNTNDAGVKEAPEQGELLDKLDQMYEAQRQLIAKYIPIEAKNGRVFPVTPIDVNVPTVQAFIKDEIHRIICELEEAADCLKNKYWKQTHVPTDVTHFHEEIADSFHFFLELCIWLDITPKKLFELYFKKHEVNQFRQRSAY